MAVLFGVLILYVTNKYTNLNDETLEVWFPDWLVILKWVLALTRWDSLTHSVDTSGIVDCAEKEAAYPPSKSPVVKWLFEADPDLDFYRRVLQSLCPTFLAKHCRVQSSSSSDFWSRVQGNVLQGFFPAGNTFECFHFLSSLFINHRALRLI